ncbi:hypothetical protein HK098_001881 [Nowakowskiella sp. JEL0407]|nr:hypothetical protein HK098_001881 [Nowakowskiella sp. JEL0407]
MKIETSETDFCNDIANMEQNIPERRKSSVDTQIIMGNHQEINDLNNWIPSSTPNIWENNSSNNEDLKQIPSILKLKPPRFTEKTEQEADRASTASFHSDTEDDNISGIEDFQVPTILLVNVKNLTSSSATFHSENKPPDDEVVESQKIFNLQRRPPPFPFLSRTSKAELFETAIENDNSPPSPLLQLKTKESGVLPPSSDDQDDTDESELPKTVNKKEDLLSDSVIQKMLQNRSKMTDVDDEFEQERLRRLAPLLRSSKKYKELRVEQANARWDDDLLNAASEMLKLESKKDEINENHEKSDLAAKEPNCDSSVLSLQSVTTTPPYDSIDNIANEIKSFTPMQSNEVSGKQQPFSAHRLAKAKIEKARTSIRLDTSSVSNENSNSSDFEYLGQKPHIQRRRVTFSEHQLVRTFINPNLQSNDLLSASNTSIATQSPATSIEKLESSPNKSTSSPTDSIAVTASTVNVVTAPASPKFELKPFWEQRSSFRSKISQVGILELQQTPLLSETTTNKPQGQPEPRWKRSKTDISNWFKKYCKIHRN